MAANITVTLSTEQVTAAKAYANKIYPNATNAELLEKLEKASYEGPGIRTQIGQWEIEALKIQNNDDRAVAIEEFNAVFPEEYVEPEPV